MHVWIFDDGAYPSGCANGLLARERPDCIKKYLAQRHVDALGPMEGSTVLVGDWLEPDETLIGVVAVQRIDGLDRLDLATAVDLTSRVRNGILYWDIQEGEWRVFIFIQTNRGGEEWTKNYLNPLDTEAVRAFIDLVYEPHYRHFGNEFGKTVLGFFSDEPRFGNASGYDCKIGCFPMVLPWSQTLMEEMSGRAGEGFLPLMPALFNEAGDRTPDLRYIYMDVVSRRFSEAFIGQIGAWCRAHGVGLIGHVVEENRAHARFGYGASHYFCAVDGMSVAGIDVVNNVYPGRTDGKYLTAFNDYDTTFNHWGLAKMASSAAHLDPKKGGNTLCEAFGAYGWSEGLKTMKWITDAISVRGVNWFVPHAFSPKEYPDSDCPPHFYARGINPLYPHFRKWANYANRVCDRLSNGRHVAPVAVLYTAEAEWGGDCEPFEAVVKQLMRTQIDCDVIPADSLIGCRIENGCFSLCDEHFRALVVPWSEYLPAPLETVFHRLADAGIPILFRKAWPKRYYLGDAFTPIPQMLLTDIDGTVDALLRRGIFDIRPAALERNLAYYHYQKDVRDLYFFTNEDMIRPIRAEIAFRDGRDAVIYDAMEDAYFRAAQTISDDGSTIRFTLRPYESLFVIFGADERPLQPRIDYLDEALNWRTIPENGWSISLSACGENHLKQFEPAGWDCLGKVCLPDRRPEFSGTVRYEAEFEALQQDLLLSLGAAYEAVRVQVNETEIGKKICPPYDFSIPAEVLRPGKNRLTVEVTNTLSKANHDNPFDRYWVQEPAGLIGPVRIALRRD